MIPRTVVDLDPAVPTGHNGWTPRGKDVSEEGFAYFRDTWLIRGVRMTEAREVCADERRLVALVDRLATSQTEFDALANALESGDPDAVPEQFESDDQLTEELTREPALDGLELGVAGLVYAVAAVGMWPAASCRGHPGDRAWADHPVVYFACDRHRAAVLQPLVEATSCGFDIDYARPELLVVGAASVSEFMDLAVLVLESPKAFVRSHAGGRTNQVFDREQQRFEI